MSAEWSSGGLDGAGAAVSDPYFAWSSGNDFEGHAAAAGQPDPTLTFIVELASHLRGDAKDAAAARAALPGLAPFYRRAARPLAGEFATVRVARSKVPDLEPGIVQAVMSLPLNQPPGDAGPKAKSARRRRAYRSAPTARRLVLGVIDRGIAFLNQSFRTGRGAADLARSRVLAVWDQGHAVSHRDGERWAAQTTFGYGRELGRLEVSELTKGCRTAADELAAYRRLAYLVHEDGALPEALHGTHVADTLAGLAETRVVAGLAKPTGDDPAQHAELVFVNVPTLGEHDTTGAGTDAYVLDAVHYILEVAGDDATVVINLSIGNQAGPHDGSSLIERALDAVLQGRPETVIVMAAGNGRRSGWNASGRLPSPAGYAPQAGDEESPTARLAWRTLPGDVTDSFLELWMRKPEGGAKGVEIRLTDPLGESAGWIGPDQQASLADAAGRVAARVVFLERSALGGDPMALFALARSQAGAGRRGPSVAGRWLIDVRNVSGGEVQLDAWVQRDEPPDGMGAAVQSALEDASAMFIDGGNTMGSLCTGRLTAPVGAQRLDGTPAPYSAGKGDHANPRSATDVVGHGKADLTATSFGLFAAGPLSGSLVRMSGTSVAAPYYARGWAHWIAEHAPPQPLHAAQLLQGFQGAGSAAPSIAAVNSA